MKVLPLVVAMALGSVSLSALADWQLSGDDSRLWFGSVKNQSIGETHHLDGLSGGIDDNGKVTIEVATEINTDTAAMTTGESTKSKGDRNNNTVLYMDGTCCQSSATTSQATP